jgi:hypothetical protein
MKKYLVLIALFVFAFGYSQQGPPHKTRTQLQLDEADETTTVNNLLTRGDDKIVDIVTWDEFITLLENEGIGGGGAGNTDLSATHSPTGVVVSSSTGDDATLLFATPINAGLLSPADKTIIDNLSSFDPTNYARTDIDEIFEQGITVIDGIRIGNQSTYGYLNFYGGGTGEVKASISFDAQTKDIVFVNNEVSGNYSFDGTVAVSDPVGNTDAVNMQYMEDNLAGTTNTTAFVPTADYHPATKKYVDDEIIAGGGYNDENAQDAIGSILLDGTSINFTYDDNTPSITGEVIMSALSITTSQITDFGTYVQSTDNTTFTGNNTFNEAITYNATNAEIDAIGENVVMSVDWYLDNLYHTGDNIAITPAGNLTSTDVQNALEELQIDIDNTVAGNIQYAITTDYTTDASNSGQKGIMTSGNTITIDGTGLLVEYENTIVNGSANNITVDIAAGQSTFNNQTLPAILAPGYYVYMEKTGATQWSVIIGGAGGGGGGDVYLAGNQTFTGNNVFDENITLNSDPTTGDHIGNVTYNDNRYATEEVDRITKNANFSTTLAEKGDFIDMTGGTTVTLDLTGLPDGYNQTVFNDTGGNVALSSANTIKGQNNSIPNGYFATYVLDSVAGEWLVSTPGAGGGSGAVDSVNGETGAVVLTSDDIDDTGQAHQFVTATDVTNLGNLSGVNSGDQTITLTGDITGSGTGSFATTIANGAVQMDDLDATGTPSASTILFGDGVWRSISGGGDMLKSVYDTNDDGAVNNTDSLGGVVASDYARLSQANTFTNIGNTFQTRLTIGDNTITNPTLYFESTNGPNTGIIQADLNAMSFNSNGISFQISSANSQLQTAWDPTTGDGIGNRDYNDGRYAINSHNHGTFDRNTADLSGATVFDRIAVTDGIVTDIGTRNITLANLGYVGDLDANNYVHPTGDGNLHVPASGSTNSGNVLTATSTPGQYVWSAPASGGMTSWDIEVDGVFKEAITQGENVSFDSGTGIQVTGTTVTNPNLTFALTNTAVTPGTYNSANITVDAQGRITSAAAGAQGTMSSFRLVDKTGTLREAITDGEDIGFVGGNGIGVVIDTTTDPDITFSLGGLSADWNAGSYNITAGGFYESSMRSLKMNIAPFTKSALELIRSLEIVSYDRIEGAKNKIGVIIEDTPEEFGNEDMTAVDIYKTVFIQAKAIQELEEKIEQLESRIEKLENGN